MADTLHPVLINGEWRKSQNAGTLKAVNPANMQPLDGDYPVSSWADCEAMLAAAHSASAEMARLPAATIAAFLEGYAARLDSHAEILSTTAAAETGLPFKPRLHDVELPRTTGQLRQAAAAIKEGSWATATIDTKNGLRSILGPLGPVWVIGPNNFPFAFNGISGGDFAAAIAAGNPVIAKAHPSHPETSRLMAVEAHAAAHDAGLPTGAIQMLYRTSGPDGLKLAADHRLKAVAFTGSRHAGIKLKAAAETAGNLFYGEMSSINPVIILPGALKERLDDIVAQFVTSALMGTGQFCTSPGLIIVPADGGEGFIKAVIAKFGDAPSGTLLSDGVEKSLLQGVSALRAAGAELLIGDEKIAGRCAIKNTLLRVSADQFLKAPVALQTEAFGNASLVVVAKDLDQMVAILRHLEGNLTGCVYSDTKGTDDAAYAKVEPELRKRVGRLINDKMPTGVAVSPAQNHGGPFPAMSHPHFTAVGIPASMRRFTALYCYDNVRDPRLPVGLRNKNPSGAMWRLIDGQWSKADLAV